jgi:hypothetical protein
MDFLVSDIIEAHTAAGTLLSRGAGGTLNWLVDADDDDWRCTNSLGGAVTTSTLVRSAMDRDAHADVVVEEGGWDATHGGGSRFLRRS